MDCGVPLAVDYVLLKIHGHGFRRAEIFHRLRNLESHLVAELEIGVNGEP